ncbi:MarR family transcriptional regulator [Brevibacillus parabrevis]|uniref:MarR family winged helix-turn-helix transcriptional regulator n=1 Tax=Brevibacillus parabrevis TaxID=54914 RepID=UPI0007ABF296|nr:MarR family transcriptional regulator [Brevibacillus parabrevis]KZE51954.1 MarR family transcriptional regulator [Brevibacillus parabrevis]
MTTDEMLMLNNQLCFTIYACSREITRMYRPYLDEMGITYPQYLVLLVLWETEESTVKELGERLFLDSGTLTPLLKRMQEAELVTRTRSSQDERVVVIRLTEKGAKMKEAACKVPQALFDSSGLSADDFMRLLKESQNLLDRIHRLNEK